MKFSKNLQGIFFLFLAAFLYSIMPVMIRTLGSDGLPPATQVFFRYIFAFIAAVVYFFFITKNKFKIQKKNLLFLAIATIFGYALTNLFFTFGILYTQVGNALFLFYSYGIITPVLGFLFLKEKLNSSNIIALILSLLALFLLFQPNSIPSWKIGGFFAIMSALGQSVYLILRKKLNNYSAAFMMIANTLVGIITLGTISLITDYSSFFFVGGISHITLKTWLITIFFGLDNFLAWFFMTKGFELFEATTGSLILLVENVFGILFALLIFKEVPTLLTIVGGFLILLSSSFVILKKT